METWIKFYRKFTDWEWYRDTNTKAVFLHLMLTANWKPGRWQGEIIEAGEKITSLEKIADETGLSVKNVRTSLAKLVKTGEIEKKTANRYTRIRIVNYCVYQGSGISERQADGNQTADGGQAVGSQAAAIKETNNLINKDIYDSCGPFEKICSLYAENIGALSPIIYEILKELYTKNGFELTERAITEAVKAGAKNIRYIEGILKNSGSGNGSRADRHLRPERKNTVRKNSFTDYDTEITDFDIEIMKRRLKNNLQETKER